MYNIHRLKGKIKKTRKSRKSRKYRKKSKKKLKKRTKKTYEKRLLHGGGKNPTPVNIYLIDIFNQVINVDIQNMETFIDGITSITGYITHINLKEYMEKKEVKILNVNNDPNDNHWYVFFLKDVDEKLYNTLIKKGKIWRTIEKNSKISELYKQYCKDVDEKKDLAINVIKRAYTTREPKNPEDRREWKDWRDFRGKNLIGCTRIHFDSQKEGICYWVSTISLILKGLSEDYLIYRRHPVLKKLKDRMIKGQSLLSSDVAGTIGCKRVFDKDVWDTYNVMLQIFIGYQNNWDKNRYTDGGYGFIMLGAALISAGHTVSIYVYRGNITADLNRNEIITFKKSLTTEILKKKELDYISLKSYWNSVTNGTRQDEYLIICSYFSNYYKDGWVPFPYSEDNKYFNDFFWKIIFEYDELNELKNNKLLHRLVGGFVITNSDIGVHALSFILCKPINNDLKIVLCDPNKNRCDIKGSYTKYLSKNAIYKIFYVFTPAHIKMPHQINEEDEANVKFPNYRMPHPLNVGSLVYPPLLEPQSSYPQPV